MLNISKRIQLKAEARGFNKVDQSIKNLDKTMRRLTTQTRNLNKSSLGLNQSMSAASQGTAAWSKHLLGLASAMRIDSFQRGLVS